MYNFIIVVTGLENFAGKRVCEPCVVKKVSDWASDDDDNKNYVEL